MRLSKYVISVSKRHKNNHAGVKKGTWMIYYYDEDWKLQTKRISPLLVPFYKIGKWHRKKMSCLECGRVFLTVVNWRDKDQECPFCYESYDEYD